MRVEKMKESACKKPKYLSLDAIAKKLALENLSNSNLDKDYKEIVQECMLFTEALEKRLKDPKATLKEIKRLFELRAAALKKARLITP